MLMPRPEPWDYPTEYSYRQAVTEWERYVAQSIRVAVPPSYNQMMNQSLNGYASQLANQAPTSCTLAEAVANGHMSMEQARNMIDLAMGQSNSRSTIIAKQETTTTNKILLLCN